MKELSSPSALKGSEKDEIDVSTHLVALILVSSFSIPWTTHYNASSEFKV